MNLEELPQIHNMAYNCRHRDCKQHSRSEGLMWWMIYLSEENQVQIDVLYPDVTYPGGHEGHHQHREGQTFMYDLYDGRRAPTQGERQASSSSSSTSSTPSDEESDGSEELQPDEEHGESRPEEAASEEKETFIAITLDIDENDFEWLAKNKNRRRGAIWLSKKTAEKGKEIDWKRLPLCEKKEFDLAMAKELSQVSISRALRNLTEEEHARLDPAQLMQMRWVLTRKGDGSAKARLVVLGLQAHNLTEVETASPTMSKVGRNLLLTVAASMKMTVKAGDVTSAFLQTNTSLQRRS